MKRRDFITLLGSAAALPLAARAQQPERVGRVGVLMNLAADDPEGLARFAVFVQELQQLGWNEGRNMRIDHRWAGGSVDLFRKYALELVALALTPCRSLIRSALALSKAWRGRAAMSLDLPCTNSA